MRFTKYKIANQNKKCINSIDHAPSYKDLSLKLFLLN